MKTVELIWTNMNININYVIVEEKSVILNDNMREFQEIS